MKLDGIIAAIPTPFDENEELALDQLSRNIERWNETRLSGYVVLGTTGEFVSLTDDERKRVLEAARETTPSQKVMLAGTGCESTRETIRASRSAAEIGCDYAIVVTPHYFRRAFDPSTLVEHYQRVADESAIPVVLYSIPSCTGVALSPEQVSSLAAHPNIVGIKDSAGDVFALSEMRRVTPEDFSVMTGMGQVLLASLVSGASGAVLAEACVAYDLCVDIRECFERRDIEKARALQDRLVALNRAVIRDHGIPGLKALMDELGFYGGPARRPLQPPAADVAARLRTAFEAATGAGIGSA